VVGGIIVIFLILKKLKKIFNQFNLIKITYLKKNKNIINYKTKLIYFKKLKMYSTNLI
jgi:hypothetical protein